MVQYGMLVGLVAPSDEVLLVVNIDFIRGSYWFYLVGPMFFTKSTLVGCFWSRALRLLRHAHKHGIGETITWHVKNVIYVIFLEYKEGWIELVFGGCFRLLQLVPKFKLQPTKLETESTLKKEQRVTWECDVFTNTMFACVLEGGGGGSLLGYGLIVQQLRVSNEWDRLPSCLSHATFTNKPG